MLPESHADEKSSTENQDEHLGLPIYIDANAPEMVDPAKQQAPTVWSGANEASFKLLRCVEAIRDLTKILEGIVSLDKALSDKRWVKILTTPLYIFATSVRDLYNELSGNAKAYSNLLPVTVKELTRRAANFAQEVPLEQNGELRTVRDKMSAHIDKATVISPDQFWSKLDLLTHFRWLRSCLVQMLYLLKIDIYAWTRDSGHPNVWSLMNVDGRVVDLYMENNEPVSILNVTLAKSPKGAVAAELQRLAVLYSEIAAKNQQVTDLVINDKAA
jgi:hypothetical protein